MTEEILFVSPETFKVLKTITDFYTSGKLSVSDATGIYVKEQFGLIMNNHSLGVLTKRVLKKGQWFVHTEEGQEKMLFMVNDPDKSICSGWDCKGKMFDKEWVFIGERFKEISHDEAMDIINEKYKI